MRAGILNKHGTIVRAARRSRSADDGVERVGKPIDRNYLKAFDGVLRRIRARNHCSREAELCRFAQPLLAAGGWADFAGEADFAENDEPGRKRLISEEVGS